MELFKNKGLGLVIIFELMLKIIGIIYNMIIYYIWRIDIMCLVFVVLNNLFIFNYFVIYY